MPFWSRRTSSTRPATTAGRVQPPTAGDRITGIGSKTAAKCAHYWPNNGTQPSPSDVCMFCGCRPTDVTQTSADLQIIKQCLRKITSAVQASSSSKASSKPTTTASSSSPSSPPSSSLSSSAAAAAATISPTASSTNTFKLMKLVRDCAAKSDCSEEHLLLVLSLATTSKLKAATTATTTLTPKAAAAARSFMHTAAANGDSAMVRYLASKGCPVNSVDALNQTPLFVAAANGHHVAVDLLAHAGAATTIRPTAGRWAGLSPLEVAIVQGDAATTAVLAAAVVRSEGCRGGGRGVNSDANGSARAGDDVGDVVDVQAAARADAVWYVALAQATAVTHGIGTDHHSVSRRHHHQQQQHHHRNNSLPSRKKNGKKRKGKGKQRKDKSKGKAKVTATANTMVSDWMLVARSTSTISTDSDTSTTSSASTAAAATPLALFHFQALANSLASSSTTEDGEAEGSPTSSSSSSSSTTTTSVSFSSSPSSSSSGGGGAADDDGDGGGAGDGIDGNSAQHQYDQQRQMQFEKLYKQMQPHCNLSPELVGTAMEILETHTAAAATLQTWWRNHSDMSKQLRLRTQAATTLQTVWRGQLVRRRYNKTLDVLRVLNKRRYLSTALVQAVEQRNVTRLNLLLGQWPDACTTATSSLIEGGWCGRTGIYLGPDITAKHAAAAADAARAAQDQSAVLNAQARKQPELSRSGGGGGGRGGSGSGNAEQAAAEWKPAERSYRFYVKTTLVSCRIHHKPSEHEVTLSVIDSAISKRHLVIQREYGSRIITNEHGQWVQLANPNNMFGEGPAWVLVSTRTDGRTPVTHYFEEKRSTDYLSMSLDCVGRLDAEVINYDRSTITAGPMFRKRLDEANPFRKGVGVDEFDEADLRVKTLLPAINLPKVLVVNPPLEPMLLVKAAADASALLLGSTVDSLAASTDDYEVVTTDADDEGDTEDNDEGVGAAGSSGTSRTKTAAAVLVLDALLTSSHIDAALPIDAIAGTTILHSCAEKNQADVIKYLLDDSDRCRKLLHLVDNNQCTALLSAVLNTATDAVGVLLVSGADPLFSQLPPPTAAGLSTSITTNTLCSGMSFEILCDDGPNNTQVCRPARVKSSNSYNHDCGYDDKHYKPGGFRMKTVSSQVRPLGWAALQNPPIPTLLPTFIPLSLVSVGDARGTINWEAYNTACAAASSGRVQQSRSMQSRSTYSAFPAGAVLNIAGFVRGPSSESSAHGTANSSVRTAAGASSPLPATFAAAGLNVDGAEHSRVLNGKGFTAATAAASTRSAELIAVLAHAGVNFDHPDSTGNTPLIRALELPAAAAAVDAHADASSLKISAAASPTTTTTTTTTKDVVAAAASAVEQLLALGCLVDVPNHNGETPLMLAARWPDTTLVELLLKAGADPTLTIEGYETTGMLTTALKVAAECGNFENVRILVAATKLAQQNGHPSYLQNEGTGSMEIELLAAVKAGHVGVASMMIEAGANPGSSAAEITRLLCSTNSLELLSRADNTTVNDLVEASKLGSVVADMAVAHANDTMKLVAKFGSDALAPASIVTARARALQQITQSLKAAKEGRQFVSVPGMEDVTPTVSLLTPPPTPPTTDESGGSSADEASINNDGECEDADDADDDDDDVVVVHRHPESCTCSSNHSTGKGKGKGKEKAAPTTTTTTPLQMLGSVLADCSTATVNTLTTQIGMKLEAEDIKTKGYVCVATIAAINHATGEYLIHFDGWSTAYDYWTLPDSPRLKCVGWCAATGYTLQQPGHRVKTWLSHWTWADYLAATGAKAVSFVDRNSDDTGVKTVTSLPLPAAAAICNVVAAAHTSIVLGAVLANAALFKDESAMQTVAELLESLIPSSEDAKKKAENELDIIQDTDDGEAGPAPAPAKTTAERVTTTAGTTDVDWASLFTDALVERIAHAHAVTMTWTVDPLDNLIQKLLKYTPDRVPDYWRQSVANYITKDLFSASPQSDAQSRNISKIKWSITMVGGLMGANWCPKKEPAATKGVAGTATNEGGVATATSTSAAKDSKSWAAPVIERCVLYQTGFDTSVAATNTEEMRKVAITFLSAHCPEKCARCGICDEDFLESKPTRVSDQRRGTEHFKKDKCTHAYCVDCLKQWIHTNLEQNLAYVRCPCTDCPVSMYEDDIERIAGDEAKNKFAKLRQANHRERLIELIKNKKLYTEVEKDSKPCPRCHVVINRYTGCDSMMCNCGHSFNWRSTKWPTVSELKAMNEA